MLNKLKSLFGVEELAEVGPEYPKKPLSYVEGIGPEYSKKLTDVGITNTEDLLAVGATKKGRVEISKKSDIDEKRILTWINHIDLFRIKGVGEEYADLLECSGVDSVPELAQRVPANLHAKMVEVNEEKNLVRALPSVSDVEDWVAQAKELPRVVTH